MTNEIHTARSETPNADEAPYDEHAAQMLRIALRHGYDDVKKYNKPSDSLYQAPYQATSQRSATEQLLRDLEAQRELLESGVVDPEALEAQLNNPQVQSRWGAQSYRQSRAKRQGNS